MLMLAGTKPLDWILTVFLLAAGDAEGEAEIAGEEAGEETGEGDE